MKSSTLNKVTGCALAAGLGLFLAVPAASAQGNRWDRREIRQDVQELRRRIRQGGGVLEPK